MRFFTRSAQPVRKNHTVMPSTNLLDGIVPNHVWHLTEPLMFLGTLESSLRHKSRYTNLPQDITTESLMQERQSKAANRYLWLPETPIVPRGNGLIRALIFRQPRLVPHRNHRSAGRD